MADRHGGHAGEEGVSSVAVSKHGQCAEGVTRRNVRVFDVGGSVGSTKYTPKPQPNEVENRVQINGEVVAGHGGDEGEEVAVVVSADAVADPRAVVVKALDATVTPAATNEGRRQMRPKGGGKGRGGKHR